MRKYTRDLYARLEAETGQATGLQAGRLHRGRRRRGSARGVPPRLGVQPLLRRRRPRDLAGAGEGAVPARAAPTTSSPASTSRRTAAPNPVDVDDGAREGRAHAGRDASSRACRSPAFIDEARRGHRRHAPPYGDIEAEYVVNCAGMWARQLGDDVGVNIPLQAAEHYYLITERDPRISPSTGRCSRIRRRTATSARRSAA